MVVGATEVMFKYILKRIFVMLPTLLGITILSFIIINLAPGSPVEQRLQQLRFGGGGAEGTRAGDGGSQGSYGVSQEVIEALKKQYGFDKPVHIRYLIWLNNVVTFNFGESFIYEEPVIDVIASKFPVSLQFGILSFLLTYLICIPLGVMKAVRDGTVFDAVTSFGFFVLYSIPPLMLGILLIVFFAGGSYFSWFSVIGISSDQYYSLSTFGKILDRAHHFILPLTCYMINSFAVLTLLMKNSLLDEIKLDYVRTARAKGLSEAAVVYRHAFRNALIPIVTGLGGYLGVFLSGSIIIERLFSLDGMGLLGFQSLLSRDYNVIMGLIFISSLVMLVGRLISDILYMVVDPRIDLN